MPSHSANNVIENEEKNATAIHPALKGTVFLASKDKKGYMIDPALIRTTGFRVSEDRGRLLENVVFLRLRMQTKEIYFHKEKKECDFILREGNQIVQAIQVTVSLSDPEARNREIDGLMEAMNTYHLREGIILTENEQDTIQTNEFRISVIPIWKWLLFQ